VSKAALEALVRTYAAECQSTPVRANLFSPGPTRTRMRAQAMPGEDPQSLPSAETVAAAMLVMCEPDFTDNGATYKYKSDGLQKLSP
jgi:NAD(P)-dependent dehydrogenase (short-subunit alcohol dehydrogenase family)